MKALPLRLKVALWSALSACASMAVALAGIQFFLSFDLLEVVDSRMDREAHEVFWDLDRQAGGPVENRREITEELMPPTLSERLIEIRGRNMELLYRSPNLKDRSLAGGSPEHYMIKFAGQPYRVGTYYHKFLTLHIGSPLGGYYSTLRHIQFALLIALPVLVLLCLAGGILVGRHALRPVRQISDAAQKITAEHLDQRLELPAANDEIYQLTEVLNATFARLEKSYNQAVHFASDASHQLKTPVAIMRMGIETLMKQPGMSAEAVSELQELLHQTRRLSSLAEGLLILARADAGQLAVNPVPTELIMLIEGCLEDAEILAEPKGIRIVRDLPERLIALADRPRLEQVLLNLLENAVKYNREGGSIHVSSGTDENGAWVAVANTGHHIPLDRLSGIFNRFSRGDTHEARPGHGLGLSIARELARAQGGELRLTRSDDELTEFELRLRLPDKPAELAPPPKAAPQLAKS